MRNILFNSQALDRAIRRAAAYIRGKSDDKEAIDTLRRIEKEIGTGNADFCYNEIRVKVPEVNQVASDRIKVAAKEGGNVGIEVKSGWAVITAMFDR